EVIIAIHAGTVIGGVVETRLPWIPPAMTRRTFGISSSHGPYRSCGVRQSSPITHSRFAIATSARRVAGEVSELLDVTQDAVRRLIGRCVGGVDRDLGVVRRLVRIGDPGELLHDPG